MNHWRPLIRSDSPLDHIHAKGMAHLDLKPDNILFRYPVEDDWHAGLFQPVLIDFGIAAKMSKTAPQAGSLAFMPPERIRLMRGEIASEGYADPSKADVYGLGVLLYRMLTGSLPFEGLPREELAEAILKNSPRSSRQINPSVPPRVDEIILSALEKEPDARPRIEEMITRLDEAMVTHPPAPPGVPRSRSSAPPGAHAVFDLGCRQPDLGDLFCGVIRARTLRQHLHHQYTKTGADTHHDRVRD